MPHLAIVAKRNLALATVALGSLVAAAPGRACEDIGVGSLARRARADVLVARGRRSDPAPIALGSTISVVVDDLKGPCARLECVLDSRGRCLLRGVNGGRVQVKGSGRWVVRLPVDPVGACDRHSSVDVSHGCASAPGSALQGRRIVCLGDSNSGKVTVGPMLWCERMAAALAPDWQVTNLSLAGMTASDLGLLSVFHGGPLYAGWHLAASLERDDGDLYILALGTNDLLRSVGAGQTLRAIGDLARQIRRAGRAVAVASVPPIYAVGREGAAARVPWVFERLVALHPEGILDFTHVPDTSDPIPRDWYGDGVHLAVGGPAHEARALAAVAWLERQLKPGG